MMQPSPMSGNPSSPSPDPARMPPGSLPPAPQGYFAQPPGSSSRSGRPAFMFGSIFGLISGAGFVVLGILWSMISLGPTIILHMLILWSLPLFIQWIFYLLAGLFASWRTGKISTGMFTSFWVNLGYLLGALVVFFLPRSHIVKIYHVPYTVMTSLFLTFGVISLLLLVGLGIGFGALGGLIGKSLSKQKSSAAVRS